MSNVDDLWGSMRQAIADQFGIPVTNEQAAGVASRLLLQGVMLLGIKDLAGAIPPALIERAVADAKAVLREQAQEKI